MAKIEMELSEYNEIISHKETLKTALEDLKKSKDDVIRLEREKIKLEEQKNEEILKVHKESENTVSVIESINTYQNVYMPKSYTEVEWRLRNLGIDIVKLENKVYSIGNPEAINPVDNIFKNIFGCMYKTNTIEIKDKKKIYSENLKDIKRELKGVAYTELDDTYKSAIEQSEKNNKTINDLRIENRELREKIEKIEEDKNSFDTMIKESESKYTSHIKYLIKVIDQLKLSSEKSMFTSNKSAINKIKNIVEINKSAILSLKDIIRYDE